MAQYDLTWQMGQYFDPHLVIPLLEFLTDRKLYDDRHILAAKLELLRNTNMVDFMIETHEQLYENVTQDLKDRRTIVVQKLKSMQEETGPIVTILENEQVTELIQNTRERDGRQLLDNLVKDFGFHADMLDTLYRYAKFQYECGNYTAAAEYLYYYRLMVPQNHQNYLNALWGKFASEILVQNWDVARDDLNRLKAYLDNSPFETDLELLQQRAWLIHWSLFVFFNHPKGRDDLIETFLNSANYLSTIQIMCPHILRYLTAAVVLNRKRKQSLKDLVKVIQLESYHYKDPITEFIECLYVHYDFDSAQKKLRECEEVLANDFFLVACLSDFIESARLLIFEMYCRIHQCISIENVAEKLNMQPDDAERWIVNLIRNARLDAKIDAKLGHVVMGTKAVSVYEQVMENTKLLSFRAQSMAFQLEKLHGEKQGPAWGVQF